MDSGNGKNKFGLNVIIVLAVAIVLAFAVACCSLFKNDPPPPPPLQPANVEAAKDLLLSVARGSHLYSVKRGGNGKKNFPTKPSDLVENIPPFVARALQGCTNQTAPFEGYLCRMVITNTPDDFLFEAFPAEGFFGDTFIITRKLLSAEKISKKGDDAVGASKEQSSGSIQGSLSLPDAKSDSPVKQSEKKELPTPQTAPPQKQQDASGNGTSSIWKTTKDRAAKGVTRIKETFNPPPPPPPPIRPANPETAKGMLRTLFQASKLYSVQNGGNGKCNFPTKPTQIADFIPHIIKKAIVFLLDEEDKAVPKDGYILVMYPAKTQNPTDDFCFVAYPAKYFTGPQFEITKSGDIKQISQE